MKANFATILRSCLRTQNSGAVFEDVAKLWCVRVSCHSRLLRPRTASMNFMNGAIGLRYTTFYTRFVNSEYVFKAPEII